MDPTVKPGYLTTEFWIVLLGNAVAMAVLFGLVSKDEQKTVYDALAQAIQNAAALAGSAAMIWKYIKSRAEVKSAVSVEKAASQNVLAADLNNRASVTQAETSSRSTNRPMGSIAILFVALSFCCSQVFATDYIFLQQGNKHFLVNQSDPTQPNKLVTIQIIPVGGGVVVPDPVVVPPPVVGDIGATVKTALALVPAYAKKDQDRRTMAFVIQFLSQATSQVTVAKGRETVKNGCDMAVGDSKANWEKFWAVVDAKLDTMALTPVSYSQAVKDIATALTVDLPATSAPPQTEFGGETYGLMPDYIKQILVWLIPYLLEMLFKQ